MSTPSPLAGPEPWNLVSEGYTTDTVPLFERYAMAALDAAAPLGGHVLDVATGPGTLAMLAARRGVRVSALDFAEQMLVRLRERITAEGITSIDVRQGDGMALPFADASFDAGFSMFGLIFFPDRARGFAELRRVLRPGAKAVVTSWPPMERVPVMSELFVAIGRALPNMPFGGGKAPLGDPAEFVAEMSGAGFVGVEVQEVTSVLHTPDMSTFWSSIVRSNAPLALLRNKLGPSAWESLSAKVHGDLVDKYGEGPRDIAMVANMAVGRVPS